MIVVGGAGLVKLSMIVMVWSEKGIAINKLDTLIFSFVVVFSV